MPLLKVLLVDDLAMYTDAVAVLLSDVPDLLLLGRYVPHDPALVRDIANLQPDVTIVDLEPLGDRAGALLSDVHRAWPSGALVVLTGSTDPDLAVTAAVGGATAWIDKGTATGQVVNVIRGVCAGQAWYPPKLLGAVLRAFQWLSAAGENSQSIGRLSQQEHDVFAAIIAGKTAEVIGRELRLSEGEARSCITHLLVRLGVDSRLAAARVAAHSTPEPYGGDQSPMRDVVTLMPPDDSTPGSDE
jgi:NarL family two-component system response regulator LiaR